MKRLYAWVANHPPGIWIMRAILRRQIILHRAELAEAAAPYLREMIENAKAAASDPSLVSGPRPPDRGIR